MLDLAAHKAHGKLMGSLANAPPEEGLNPAADQPVTSPLLRKAAHSLVLRIAASAQFRRSARLRDFLLYVGTQSLKERWSGYP